MDPIQDLISRHGGELSQELTSKAGLGADQAQSFLPAMADQLAGALGGGGLDLSALLSGGDLAGLISKLDPSALAAAANLDETSAKRALEAVLPKLLSLLGERAGGVEGLLGALGDGQGLLGAAGKLAGGFFKS